MTGSGVARGPGRVASGMASRRAMATAGRGLALAVAFWLMAAAGAPAALPAQSTLERTIGLPEAWAGIPWSVELSIRPLFGRAGDGASGLWADPAIRLALPLPGAVVAEARYAPQPVEIGGADEVEAALRWVPLRQAHGQAVDVAIEGRYGTAAGMGAASATAGRWLGPVRILGAAQAFVQDGRSPVLALGGGAVVHPGPGRLPIALAGDATAVAAGGTGDEGVAWSAGVQVGVGHTAHTVSLFATNAGHSLGGRVADRGEVRVGVELTTDIPVGRFLGLWPDRQAARESVAAVDGPPSTGPAPAATIRIAEYRYTADRVVVTAGSVVEWVNEDAVVHTATADNRAWDSGGLAQGESWRAVFERPGIYPYYCGPHPYMRGVVIVRPE